MDFDAFVDRRHTQSSKWDMMESHFGVSAIDGLAMWVADMDFRSPEVVQRALRSMSEHGVYGYHGEEIPAQEAVQWWMRKQHDWLIERDWVFTTYGVLNGIALTIQAFTKPGDGIIMFTPVYHSFSRLTEANNRRVVECPLVLNNGLLEFNFDYYDTLLDGSERMVILCSPHNPGGRVWSHEELQDVADFATRHKLVLVSDEIHQDLVYPDFTHVPTALVKSDISDRLVVLTSPSKTFNIAGVRTGNVIISNPDMMKVFGNCLEKFGISPSSFGQKLTQAVYSPEGIEWVEKLIPYLKENYDLFHESINEISGLNSMSIQATYLAWVDFSETRLPHEIVMNKILKEAKIVASHGGEFGTGGKNFIRFNIGTQRSRIYEALERIKCAFSKKCTSSSCT